MEKERFEKTKNILEESMTIMDKVNSQIVDDGIIAQDEIDLFHIIDNNLKKYQQLLEDVLDDGVVTDEEIDKMFEFEQKINNAVQEQAIDDGKISVPESELINELFDNLKLIGSSRDLKSR